MSRETKILRKVKADWRDIIHEVNVLQSIAVDAGFDEDPELLEQMLMSSHDGADVKAFIDLGLDKMEAYYKKLDFSLGEAAEVFGDRLSDLAGDFYTIKNSKRYPDVIRDQAGKIEQMTRDLRTESMDYLNSKIDGKSE